MKSINVGKYKLLRLDDRNFCIDTLNSKGRFHPNNRQYFPDLPEAIRALRVLVMMDDADHQEIASLSRLEQAITASSDRFEKLLQDILRNRPEQSSLF